MYLHQYIELRDSLSAADLSQQIAEMQARYEADQKDKALNLQDIQLASQRSALYQQKLLILGLSLVFILGCAVAILLFNRYKLRQRNLKLSLENEQYKLTQNLQLRENIDDTIQYFATSLYGKNTIEEILWDVAQNCIAKLGFVDCVIYLVDEDKQKLIQKAAYGNKKSDDDTILEPLEVPIGKGIVGNVVATGKAEIVSDTSKDPRYIVDDERRLSEIAVPILLQDQVIGVIDSEHPQKGFFEDRHLEALQTISAICGSKIAQAKADEQAKIARLVQIEADHIKKMDQVKSHIFANISHEFRTPLQLILAPLKKDPQQISSKDTSMIARNAQSLLRLVNQLLDLAKLEVGMLKLNNQSINIFTYLSYISQSFIPLAENKGIQYQIDIPNRDLIINTDPDKFEKIIYNLLSNAIKFTKKGGTVTLHAMKERENILRIVVSDTGIGIPKAQQPYIFERFYQVDSSKNRSFEGTGIGLALTKELIDLLGGSIDIDSIEGKGSSFTISFPFEVVSQAQTLTPTLKLQESIYHPEAENNSYPIHIGDEWSEEEKPTILLADDHEELRAYVSEQLSIRYKIHTAVHGEDALAQSLEHIPDIIVTDVMMPVMDGLELADALKHNALTSHIPVILLTAREDLETKKTGFVTGADQYLVKPFDIEELIARIDSLIVQRNRLKEKYSREVVLQPTQKSIPDREAAFLENIIQIIEDHLTEDDFTVETLQKKLGMSRMQLHRKLKALTDQSTSEFIRSIRLKRAAQLLKNPQMQVAEAAYLSGFNHLSYFTKCFKEAYGVLPSDFANVQYKNSSSQKRA